MLSNILERLIFDCVMKARDNQEWDKTNGIFDLTSMKKSSTVLTATVSWLDIHDYIAYLLQPWLSVFCRWETELQWG